MKNLKLCLFTLLSIMIVGIMNVNAAEYAVKIGDKSYTFDEILTAFASTEPNDEVVILDDIDLTGAIPSQPEGERADYIPLADGVTIDLNGKSIKTNNNSITFVGNDITIKNGKFTVNGYGKDNEGSYALFVGRLGHDSEGYVLENLVLEGGLNVKSAEVVLRDVTITGTNYYAVWAEHGSTVMIESGNYSSKSGTIINCDEETSIVTVMGGTFNDFIPGYYYGAGFDVTIKLTEDMSLNGVMDLAGRMTIDLNGHNIIQNEVGANVFTIQDAKVNITGNGKIVSHSSASYAIRILGSGNREDREYTVVNIGKDVTVESNGYGAYISTVDGYKAYGVQVDIYGTLKGGYNGFYVTGNIQDKDEKGNFANFPVINIHDGANVEGVYAAGYAVWNIGAATIKDKEYGIGIKAGNFVFDGTTITATGEKAEPVGNGNGMNGTGSAIQFETNAGYADNIDVTLRDVTVSSTNGYAILEYLGQTKILNLEIISGTFKSAKGLEIIKVSDKFDQTGFIKGGTYSADVNKYIATGLVSKKVGDMYTVAKENSVTIGKVTAGKAEVDKTKAVVGEKVTLTLTPNEGYKISSIKVVDTYNKEVSVTDNAFVMPDSNVTIEVVFVKSTITTEIPVIDPDKKVEETVVGVKNETSVEEVILDTIAKDAELAAKIEGVDVTVGVEIDKVDSSNVPNKVAEAMKEKAGNATITNFFDITIVVKDAAGTINEKISELNKEIELMVMLPEELILAKDGMTRKYYIVREHVVDGKSQVDLLDAKVSEDGKSLVFKTDRFSTYAIAYEDVAITSQTPSTPQTGDNVMLYIALGFVSIAAIGISLNNLKRRSSK